MLFAGKRIARFTNFESVALRKLQQLNAATALDFLRVCFVWDNGHVRNVEIVDYH
jgi:proteic killer suppression protein